ncbi:conjugal transfer protein TraO [Alistipes ihumii]|uniref:conjugal transfer protein TraO n=1 Tax=Alistipes ihumii TaxID=1470347 RepID=UPI003FEFC0C8
MKNRSRVIVALAVMILSCAFTRSFAQQLPGRVGIQLSGGSDGGFLLRNEHGAWRFHAGLSCIRYGSRGRYWEFGAGYLRKDYVYRDALVPKAQLTVEAGYFIPLVRGCRDKMALTAGLSALAGYETSNRGRKQLYDGATLTDPDCFVYGGALSVQAEGYLSDRFAVLLQMRERLLGGSSITRFHTLLGIGIRVIIN